MKETDIDKLFAEQDAHWERYEPLLPPADQVELLVLKGHLIIEEMLYKLAEEHCSDPTHLESARLNFSQLLSLTRALVRLGLMSKCWEAIAKLNTLRNKMAHHLEPKNIDAYALEFEKLCTPSGGWPKGYTPPVASGEKIKAGICFIIGQLTAISTVNAFFERNRRFAPEEKSAASK